MLWLKIKNLGGLPLSHSSRVQESWFARLNKSRVDIVSHSTVVLFESESESHSVVLDSLQPHRLYGPWNSSGQNTGVGCHSLLQGILPT